MRKAFGFIAVFTLITAGIFAGRHFVTPDDAAVNCPTIQQYLNDGYTMDSCFGNAHRYITEPTGIYEWGYVYTSLHKATGGPYSLETTYVDVRCTIQANDKHGHVKYRETNNQVSERIVY